MFSVGRRYLPSILPKSQVLCSQVHTFQNDIKQRSYSSNSLIQDEKKNPKIANVTSKKKQSTARTHMRNYSKSTRDEKEIKHFSSLANLWWDENGEFAALHTMNELRIPLVRDGLLQHKIPTSEQEGRSHQLDGFKILDVGCGGGILSEPLARLGAEVTGLEASEETIKIARSHLVKDADIADKVTYIHSTVEELAETHKGSFDAVVASEVVEHVADVSMFIEGCSKLLKPGGSLFVTTLNKTYLSYALAIFAAERILNIVPRGTHDWNKFVDPQDLQYILNKNGLTTRLVHGMCYNVLTKRWFWMKDTSMNYALHAVLSTDS